MSSPLSVCLLIWLFVSKITQKQLSGLTRSSLEGCGVGQGRTHWASVCFWLRGQIQDFSFFPPFLDRVFFFLTFSPLSQEINHGSRWDKSFIIREQISVTVQFGFAWLSLGRLLCLGGGMCSVVICVEQILIDLWWTARGFISSYRCRSSMCLLPGIHRALAMASVSKEGSRASTAPLIPLPWRLSANSWGARSRGSLFLCVQHSWEESLQMLSIVLQVVRRVQRSDLIACKEKPQSWWGFKTNRRLSLWGRNCVLDLRATCLCQSRGSQSQKNTCVVFCYVYLCKTCVSFCVFLSAAVKQQSNKAIIMFAGDQETQTERDLVPICAGKLPSKGSAVTDLPPTLRSMSLIHFITLWHVQTMGSRSWCSHFARRACRACENTTHR